MMLGRSGGTYTGDFIYTIELLGPYGARATQNRKDWIMDAWVFARDRARDLAQLERFKDEVWVTLPRFDGANKDIIEFKYNNETTFAVFLDEWLFTMNAHPSGQYKLLLPPELRRPKPNVKCDECERKQAHIDTFMARIGDFKSERQAVIATLAQFPIEILLESFNKAQQNLSPEVLEKARQNEEQ